MKRQLIVLLLIVYSSVAFGQNDSDYVILRPTNTSNKTDTVFGNITIPKNGMVINVKIKTAEGKRKYHPDEAIGFLCGDKYFASVPYNSRGHVFAERIVKGKVDLCHYSSTPKNYNGGLMGVAVTGLTSFYFIKSDTTDEYIRVPHSKQKMVEEIASLFKDNEKVYHQITSEDFRTWDLTELVKQYDNVK